LTVPSGQRIAIVGGSGSGKSTLFALALRFYAPKQGRVLLDGQDLRNFDNRELRSKVAWVQQEPPLFPNLTIRENIAYGLKDCPLERVKSAADEANATDFIMTFPDGFDTRIGAAGTSLSGGQKQRIALARALVRDPALLLLDEATSALDVESQQLVEAAIARASENRTVLFTTHTVSQARSVDRIIVIARGSIVEDGTHEELMRLNGAYAQLVRLGDGLSEDEASCVVDQSAGMFGMPDQGVTAAAS
jgi:ABC-type multidrug transport system fused ATPase/permease subunit